MGGGVFAEDGARFIDGLDTLCIKSSGLDPHTAHHAGQWSG